MPLPRKHCCTKATLHNSEKILQNFGDTSTFPKPEYKENSQYKFLISGWPPPPLWNVSENSSVFWKSRLPFGMAPNLLVLHRSVEALRSHINYQIHSHRPKPVELGNTGGHSFYFLLIGKSWKSLKGQEMQVLSKLWFQTPLHTKGHFQNSQKGKCIM